MEGRRVVKSFYVYMAECTTVVQDSGLEHFSLVEAQASLPSVASLLASATLLCILVILTAILVHRVEPEFESLNALLPA